MSTWIDDAIPGMPCTSASIAAETVPLTPSAPPMCTGTPIDISSGSVERQCFLTATTV